MAEFSSYAPGTFCWTDLGTTDAEGAKAFYTALFGWEAVDTPAGPDMVYTMFSVNGKSVAALYQMSAEQAQGMPPFWLSYVSVADATAAAAKAKKLGGAVMQEAFDVMDAGRMAMIQDPTGAIFALWEPKAHFGAALANVPGALSWNELGTYDTDAAAKFYTGLFGWTAQVQKEPFEYTTFMNGERMNGGMMKITEEWGDNVPPHWMVYFAVADCDASAEKVKKLGGQVHMGPRDIPQVGRFALVQDPQGGMFTIIQLENPE